MTCDSGAEGLVSVHLLRFHLCFRSGVSVRCHSAAHPLPVTQLTGSCFLTTHKRVKGAVEVEWTFSPSCFPVCGKSQWLHPAVSPEAILARLIKTDRHLSLRI